MIIYFIGIGGIGISALARAYQAQKHQIFGSELSVSDLTSNLAVSGITIFPEHQSTNIPQNTSLIIYSEAIPNDNPELVYARQHHIRTLTYFQALGEFSRNKKTIAIAGTHGKTTTTAMTGLCLMNGDIDPSIIVGSKMPELNNSNYRYGKSEYLVVEACEYRESFLNLSPFIGVITNCEPDHLDYYQNKANYYAAFRKFVAKIPNNGYLIYHQNDPNIGDILPATKCKLIGISTCKNIPILQIPGKHNRENAVLAAKISEILNIPKQKYEASLQQFKGTWRRFEIIAETEAITLIDDYAHHPTEIKATLSATREKYPDKKIICVFQPHQYSRSYQLLDQFKNCFKNADQVIIPNIYAARDTEKDRARISAQSFAEAINHPQVIYTGTLEATIKYLSPTMKANQLIISMGAGDVWQVSHRLADQFLT